MKIVVIGGTGLIGSKLVKKLKNIGHEVVAASPSNNINTLTGEGLADALNGAEVVVDVSNAPSFQDKTILEFFLNSGRNLFAAEKAAGTSHHIALSIVGSHFLPENGYFRAKNAQEELIKLSNIPYTILRSTQFFEFLESIVQAGSVDQSVQVPQASLQPIASEDVVNALLQVVFEAPTNGIIEIAGPQQFTFCEIVEKYLKAINDPRQVIAEAPALYFGSKLSDTTLVPDKDARLGVIDFESWFESQKNIAPHSNEELTYTK